MRRCSVHSRSNSDKQIAMAVADDLHLDMARFWTNFSISMRSSPNAALASRLALTMAAASFARPSARRRCRGRRRRRTP